METTMNLKLLVWRQPGPDAPGKMEEYDAKEISSDCSFLEMLDLVNEDLIKAGKQPIVFDNDCREGICGCCGMMVDGVAHGPDHGITICQLHMRHFHDGATIVIEPFRSRAFAVIKDLVVDRTAFDMIQAAGGYVSFQTGSAQDANAILVPKEKADLAMDAAACIGCGACVAQCKNASALLFTSAKVSQFALLPQGDPERKARVKNMLAAHDAAGFGSCSNEGECEAVCPKEISISNIARLNRELIRSNF
ncbi:MAG: succinate dehydrogenase/fumarate reductase iron-sulfur subunit [Deltaproteobacteria bacterium]|nr:succinate dehydrogenase/fumarate reductase iron-sulfur subunit [Deltaproteobacteria bacterium]